MEVGINSLGRVFLFEGSQEAMQRASQVAISVAASIQLSGIAQWLYPWFHLRGTGAGLSTISGGRGWSGHLGSQWG